MTDSFSTYPEDMKLSLHNVAAWENYVQKVISAYSDMGTAIRKNIPFVLHRPTTEDMFPDTDVRMYNFVPTVLAEDEETPPRILDTTSHSAYSAAMVLYMKMDKSRRDEEAKLCTFLKTSFSLEAEMTLRSTPEYVVADIANDSFNMFKIARDSHACATSFYVAQRACIQLFQMKMDGSFASYSDALLNLRRIWNSLFDKDKTGAIKIDDLFLIAFVQGLPDSKFQFMKDQLYAKNLDDGIPNFAATLTLMKTYDLAKQKVDDNFVPPGPTALSTVVPTKLTCPLCKNLYPAVKRRDTGEFFDKCASCNKKLRDKAIAKAANPTEAQIKKAQAVILAASVNINIKASPTEPPPPTADYLTKYMDNYALSSSTAIINTSPPPPDQLALPWCADSGATFTMTNCLADLVLPALLPKPIPIGSANGSTLYATHVGSSCFDSRLQVYFVPQSAVKLLSLGSLSALGYTYASGHDRSLTIHTPAGRILCTCPIQPNNIWFFPTHLISPAKVPNHSNVNFPNVSFQFLTPLNPTHFSKEQVKRATQARDLHHFLSHPSDDALRTTID